ncbi:hypothetical protein, unknown function [Leishmania mexicana MHOM/GT/2001/U1103]|uniref:Uncharacterized protein n=1 Tax=Leishmania mexicana (strain MHOM/GT/2001/U1103) TaxID=929439 RepID=E9B1B5_LEIMU|nr:hypothetical protein, unknown function [Leishmania mexicana MHOM/GT/2001/U1103]CBZ29021.1 hypothetical protein, unknown function [Leishmania mexicana MHOM/GT/2001/U1103]
MRLHLEDAYEELCAEYNTTPLCSFRSSLRNTYASPDGEVFMDGSYVEGDHFCVFAELLRRLLRQPIAFIKPAIVQLGTVAPQLGNSVLYTPEAQVGQVYYAVPPRLLRIKLLLSRNVNNADVERVCRLIVAQKVLDCVPFPGSHSNSTKASTQATGSLPKLSWPERAAIESIDLHNCVFVSLPGGRALRAAARRNVYVQNVFLEGCSVNAAVVAQIARATRSNREQFRLVCTSS